MIQKISTPKFTSQRSVGLKNSCRVLLVSNETRRSQASKFGPRDLRARALRKMFFEKWTRITRDPGISNETISFKMRRRSSSRPSARKMTLRGRTPQKIDASAGSETASLGCLLAGWSSSGWLVVFWLPFVRWIFKNPEDLDPQIHKPEFREFQMKPAEIN